MSRNAATFIALGSTAEKVADVLRDWVEVECTHEHKKSCAQVIAYGDDGCDHSVEVTNLDEVAVRIAEILEREELAP